MAYTLVQHSAFAFKRDVQFQHAVEECSVATRDVARVVKAGGLIFNEYKEAYDAAYDVNYPEGTSGLIPQTKGKFAKLEIDGQAVYLPPKK